MASIINASSSSGIVQTADTSGILQLQSNGTTIATINSTGLSTQVGSPTFRAVSTGTQSISSGVYTKVTFNSEVWDTNNNYDPTTNYRFTPTVAGYYQVNMSIDAGATTACTRLIPLIYKNGSIYSNSQNGNSTQWYNTGYSDIVSMNGTTDYIEAYCYVLGTSPIITSSSANFFSAAMVRSA